MNYFEFATHIASVLTLLAYLVKEMLWLRFLTILASVAGIIFNYFVPATPLWAVIWWNVVFIIINVVQIMIIFKERSNVTFTEEERELYETLFKDFEPFEFMKLLRIGTWLEARKGQALTIDQQTITQGSVLGRPRRRRAIEDHRIRHIGLPIQWYGGRKGRCGTAPP